MIISIDKEKIDNLHKLYSRYNSYAALIFENETQYLEKYVKAYCDYTYMLRDICIEHDIGSTANSNIDFVKGTITYKKTESYTFLDIVPEDNVLPVYIENMAYTFLSDNYLTTDAVDLSFLIDLTTKSRIKFENAVNNTAEYYDYLANKYFTKE